MLVFMLVCLVPLTASCPHNGPGPVINPYSVARAAIQAAQLTLLVSDGVFDTWAAAQTNPVKVAAARAKYVKVRTCVADSLRLAMDAVAIAEAVGQKVDLAQILAQAEVAYQDLLKLLKDLKSGPASTPASAPAPKVELPELFEKLPPTLIPPKR
jgi:hypothetical protein